MNHNTLPNSDMFWSNFDAQIVIWRQNIHRFIGEYFGVKLADFQKIILFLLDQDTGNIRNFMFWASRGLGKSFLTMLYAIAKGTLYPGIKIVIAAPTLDQALLTFDKASELSEMFPNIGHEIQHHYANKTGAVIRLRNGSIIKTVVAANTARGNRGQILILEEFIGINREIIEDVLSKFLTEVRRCGYHNLPKYEKYKSNETNKKIYLSSIGSSSDWSYEEFLTFITMMKRGDKNYCAVAIPYQLGVKAGFITDGYIKSEVSKPNTDIAKFRSEMECIPLGEDEGSIFKYNSFLKCRELLDPLYPMTDFDYYEAKNGVKYNDSNGSMDYENKIRYNYKYYQPKVDGEIRLLSADIATIGGKNNDESAYIVYRLFPETSIRVNPTTGEEVKELKYLKQVSYIETNNGVSPDQQALRLKQLFYDLECDYMAIDAVGVGMSVYSICMRKTYDPTRNKFYNAWGSINMPVEGWVEENDAEKVVYLVKTSGLKASTMLMEMVSALTINLDRGDIRFLKPVVDVYDYLDSRYNYSFLKSNMESKYSDDAKRISYPYEQTTELITQAVTIKKVNKGVGIQIKEAKSTDRKDMIMSLLYGIHVITELEKDLIYSKKDNDFSNFAVTSNKKIVHNNRFGGVGFKGFGRDTYSGFFR